ncbi:hypothetical protein BESB_028600 [Besnoitia besnoiti]|uniref:Nuclear protein Es2 n=1 Tax=Besnoitia besnoiti TaxID=94643 RepID=A0A2A9M0C2_BESBE|nr:uncharacterized protein BESB_028600 [Besnoitia besnoiti]PFH31425.1 hypothetical protein BESB_028600 [Besnoitia besnoiti]
MLKLLHALLEAERRRDVHAAVQLLRRIRALTPASVVNRQGAFGTCCGPSPQYTALGTPGLSSSSSAGEAAREQPTSEERVSCSAPSESALPASATRPADTTESPPRRDAENRRARPAESLPSQAGAAGHEREAERDASPSPAYAEADPRRRRGRQGSALLDPEVKENEEIRWKRRRRGDGRYEDSPGPSVSEAGSPLRLRRGPAADDTPVMSSGVSSHARRRSLTRVGRGDDIIVPQGAGKLHRVRTELRLDAFLSRYTSTDNKSFSELVKLEKIEKEKSQRWIDSTQEEHNARMIEIQKKTVTGEHAGQLAVGFFSSRNNLYYKNCDVVDAHRQPYELNRRSGEINNVNTRYCTSERQRQHALYSRQVEKKQHLAATEEQRKALEASAAETPFPREEREKQEEATIKKASDTAVALPGPVSGYGNVDLALRTNEEPQLPTVTWGELLSSPALAQAASPSTPFLQSSIFEPCPVNSYAGVSGQLANTVNLATFKMPDPLPREKALARLQDRASARVREQQLKRQQLVGAAVGQGSPRCRLAAARAAAVVLGRAGRSGRSGSSIGLAAVRRSTGSASRSSEEVQRILRLATGSRDGDMRGSETASRSRRKKTGLHRILTKELQVGVAGSDAHAPHRIHCW